MNVANILSDRRMNFWVLALGFAAAIVVLAVVTIRIFLSRDEALVQAGNKAQQLARILEAGVSGTLQSAEILLDSVIAEAKARASKNPLANHPISATLRDIAQDWSFVQSISFVGPDGKVIDAALRDGEGRLQSALEDYDVSNLDTFTVHAGTAADAPAMFISEVRKGYITQEPLIIATKGVWSDDKRFLGVASVAIHMSEFEKLFEGLLPEVDGTISLFRADGTLLLSTPFTNLVVGHVYKKSRLFSRAVHEAPSGVYTAPAMDDGIGRRLAYQVGTRYPFVIAVGLPLGDVLAGWRRSSFINAGAAIFGAIVICSLSIGLAVWIRRQRAAQIKLIKSDESFAESQRLSGIGHFERDLKTRAYTWSTNLYDIHGVSPATFTPGDNKQFIGLVVEEDRDYVEREMRALISRHLPGQIECRIRRPDGAIRSMRYSWYVIPDESGVEQRMFGVAQDLTMLRSAEAARRENEARLSDILECSSDFVWESDGDGTITLFTGTGADLFQTVTGFHGHMFYGPTDEASDLEELGAALRARRQFRNLSVPARAANGGVRWVRVSGNPVFDIDGRFKGYRGAGIDATETRRQLQLLEQQRKGEALGRLASGLAHEVNNLMQPVLIYASSGVSSTEPASPVRTYFDRIMRAAERTTSIVRNVLAFSRHGPPQREDVMLDGAVRDVLELSVALQASGVNFDIAYDTLDRAVRVDRTGLSQVLLNLITNAVEAMDGNGTISIFAEAFDVISSDAQVGGLRAGRYTRVVVADTGSGIAAENLGQVFDPFFTTKPQGQGTGLGLSVVAGMVKTWGGAVQAANRAEGGAVFSIYLPDMSPLVQAAQ